MRWLIVLVVALVCGAMMGPAGLRAQEATPTAGVGDAIDPSACRVAPRSAEEVLAVWSAEAGVATPTAATDDWYVDETLTAAPVPLGDPAEGEIVAAITAVVRESYACANADDLGRSLALVSDATLRRLGREFGPADGMTLDSVRSLLAAPAEPLPVQERYRLVAVTDVSVMTDGRIAAFVIEDDPTEPPAGPTTELDLFIEERGRWVFDGALLFTDEEALSSPEGAAPPVADATPVDALPGLSGRSYRSPSYGYTLAWEANWTVDYSTTADDEDQLQLRWGAFAVANFHSRPAGAGTNLPVEPDACLEAIVRGLSDDPRFANFGLAPSSVGTPIGSGANVAAGVYAGDFTSQSGNTSPFVFFLSCRSLSPDAVLFITYVVGPDEADEMAPLFRALDASIMLSGDALRTNGSLGSSSTWSGGPRGASLTYARSDRSDP